MTAPSVRSLALPLLAFAAASCGGDGGGGGGPDFGEYRLDSLSETCEGIPGLTGQAILDQQVTHMETELGYITAGGDRIDLTPLTMDVAWPAEAVATCYPAYEEDGLTLAQPRVQIHGLDLEFVTDDGRFDESLDAAGILLVVTGTALQGPLVVATTTRGDLDGTWEPFPDYEPVGRTVTFASSLIAANPDLTGGNVSIRDASVSLVEGGVFPSGFAMATW